MITIYSPILGFVELIAGIIITGELDFMRIFQNIQLFRIGRNNAMGNDNIGLPTKFWIEYDDYNYRSDA